MDRSARALRLIGAMALAMAFALQAGTATAAQPNRVDEHRTFINCFGLNADGVLASLSVDSTDRVGSSAGLQVVLDPNDPTATPLVNGYTSVELSPDGTNLSGTMELVPGDFGVQSAGTASFSASFTPSGPTETHENFFNDSNVKHRSSETFGPLDVSGSLSVVVPGRPSIVFSLDECSGLVSDFSSFTNAPSSSVTWRSEQFLLCTYVTDELYVGLHAEAAAGLIGADMIVLTPSASFGNTSDNVVTLNRNEFATTFTLVEGGAGLDSGLSGTADASAVLTALETIEFQLRSEDGRRRVDVSVFSALGAIDIGLSDGTQITVPLNDETCHTNYLQSERDMESSPRGGNRQPVANDTPTTAQPVERGEAANSHTGGAAFDGEAFASCVFDGPFLLNVSHSTWYSVIGDGQPLSVDTAGSDFDTVVAAYVTGAEGLTEVACNDESETATPHQASLAFATDPGVTYLIQVGGYIDQSGHLRLAVD